MPDAAQGEQIFIDHLTSEGWPARWITIIGEDTGGYAPDADDANAWITSHDLGEDATVLYDSDQQWYDAVFTDKWPQEERSWPMVFTAHTSNMLVWDSMSGWSDPDDVSSYDDFMSWFSDSLFPYIEGQEGAIDTE